MEVLQIIIGMSAVTILPRLLPMLLPIKSDLRFLRYIPISVFSAIVFPELISFDHGIALGTKTLAGFLTFLVAVRTRNILITMISGIIILYILNLL